LQCDASEREAVTAGAKASQRQLLTSKLHSDGDGRHNGARILSCKKKINNNKTIDRQKNIGRRVQMKRRKPT
jgi:hypothetical protein